MYKRQVYRLGTFVPLPGIDPEQLQTLMEGNQKGLLGMFNVFAGGAVSRMAIFALGIMPYISSSIIVQLLTGVSDYFKNLKSQGETGRKKITIVHKANILKALTGLFLETALDVGKEYEGKLEIEERIVDNTAMQLVINPSQFDIILTTNMFGDILSDEIAGLIGGLGLAPSGNIGNDVAIFEAVHGTAPDIVGKGTANPTALYLASAMMLDHVDEKKMADSLRKAIRETLKNKENRTSDLGGTASTEKYTSLVISNLN